VPTAFTGTFTTASSVVREKKLGKICHLNVQVTITTVGTGSAQILVTIPTAPFLATAASAIDNSNGGINMVAQVSGTTLSIIPTAGAITSGNTYLASATYEIS
jgi:hypothetical protein